MYTRAITFVGLFVLLVGCASTPQLGAEDRTRFGAVRIDAAVDTPDNMYYLGPGSGIGMMFGALGGAITAAANLSPGERLRLFALDHDIHIDQIVLEEAGQAFQQSGKLKLTVAPGADVATMKLTIKMYGFSIPNGFSSDLVPLVSIQCTLTDPSGKVVWTAHDMTYTLGNPWNGNTPEELRTDPKLIERAWRAAAHKVMTNIASNM